MPDIKAHQPTKKQPTQPGQPPAWWEEPLWNLIFRGTEPFTPRATPGTSLSAYGESRLKAKGVPLPKGASVAPTTPGESTLIAQRQAQDALDALNLGQPPITTATELPTGAQERFYDEDGYLYVWDKSTGSYIKSGYDPSKATRAPTEQNLWEREFQEREAQTRKEEQEATRAWWREQAVMEAEQEKQKQLASLQANPKSWLEYGLLAGQTPGIQPWMQPLMPQQYAGFGAGQAIPGYNPVGQGLGLPELTPPSRQYQARMGPTAQQQYYGYEQARTGATPEETQFRLWSQAPPGGRSSSLSWMR